MSVKDSREVEKLRQDLVAAQARESLLREQLVQLQDYSVRPRLHRVCGAVVGAADVCQSNVISAAAVSSHHSSTGRKKSHFFGDGAAR